MEQSALTETLKTNLQFPRPSSRKRLFVRFATFVVVLFVLSAAYWYTKPQELRWWTSPAIGVNGRHFRLLIPNGWKLQMPVNPRQNSDGEQYADYRFVPIDRRPDFLRNVFPIRIERASLA